MNTLQSNLAIAISKDIEINKENLITVSSSCTTIAIEYMGKMAEWTDKKGFYQVDNRKSQFYMLWFNEDIKDGITTEQLTKLFIQTLK